MSRTPSVKIGFGFILDVRTEDFAEKMVTAFPNIRSNVKRGISPASHLGSEFSTKYYHLSVDELTDPIGNFTQVVVYSDHWQELYGNTLEGQEAVAGAIYPEDVTPPKVLPFKKFMEDFGITHPPKVVVWTRWA